MNINDIAEVKDAFASFKDEFDKGNKNEAYNVLKDILEQLESGYEKKKDCVYISLNHVMEYYIFAFYFKPEKEVVCTEIPFSEYYRTFGELCISMEKYHRAKEAFENAIEWNPVDLDAYWGLAECYKYLNMLNDYREITEKAYNYCCTRATMARYYRNMGFFYLSKYNPDIARKCYVYGNIYYRTENADNELKYLETALADKTPEYSLSEMQNSFDKEGIEPGPNPDTIGVIYRVGELMMEDEEFKLAKDCFSIVYDITREKGLEKILDELSEYDI